MKKIYLVGGAVRSKLLNLPVNDRDFVVIGSSAKEMLALGFLRVGHSFPVFIHPVTKEEYALARRERKSGSGYAGFEVDCDKSITLEEDLHRRDITINAIAMDLEDNDKIYDFNNGIDDLKNRVIRHVSCHFIEDPLRVIRICRFVALLHDFNFTIADETDAIMRKLIHGGELLSLSPNRLLLELKKVFENTKYPDVFFQTMKKYKVLDQVLTAFAAMPPEDYSYLRRGCRVHKCKDALLLGLSLISCRMKSTEVDKLVDELPLSRKQRYFCTFFNRWHGYLGSLTDMEVCKILDLIKSVKHPYFDTLSEVISDIDDALNTRSQVTSLKEMYLLLKSAPYAKLIRGSENFNLQKAKLQKQLILEYIEECRRR